MLAIDDKSLNEFGQFPWTRQKYIKAHKIPQYSFVDVVEQQIPTQTFQNKIVLVGVTAPGIDGLITSFDYDRPTGDVCVHATMTSNALQSNFFHPFPPRGSVMLFVLGRSGLYWAIAVVLLDN
ncbi:CHASE2 domain-containing protein [Trichormus azollae]|uniref:CHASE2 domain-containing protein n=1 Tax=Trichormus azollae TaxID=1164 RepID=UPI00325E7044